MYVRDISKNIGATLISKEFDKILKKNEALNTSKILDGFSEVQIVDIKIAYNLLKENLRKMAATFFQLK